MLRERAGHTLQTAAVVNEAYLRLIDAQQVEWKFARSRSRNKRGGNIRKVELDEALVISPQRGTDLVVLDVGMVAPATMDERKAKVSCAPSGD
jgi:uncharacterized Zn finger protein